MKGKSSGTKLFITFLSNERKKFRYETFYYLLSTWKEKDTIFLCWLFLHRQLSTHSPNRRAAPVAHKLIWHRPGLNPTLSFVGKNSTACLFFLIQKSSAHASGYDVIHTPQFHFLSGAFVVTSVNDTSSRRAWTPALNVCT